MAPKKVDNVNKTVLVTGASSGIGRGLAGVFARHGFNLVLVARRQKELHAVANTLTQQCSVKCDVVVKDLSPPDAAVCLWEELQRRAIHVDVLINNAGFGAFGLFAHETRLCDEMDMIHLNMRTLTQLTKLFLPAMVEKRQGHIMNVGSIAGFQPGGPYMAVYYATKAYVLSFSEGLAEELVGSGVCVTVLCPGPTRTEFGQRAKAAFRSSKLMSFIQTDLDHVCRKGFEGLMRGKRIVIPGFLNRCVILMERFFPRRFVTRMVGKNQKRMRTKE